MRNRDGDGGGDMWDGIGMSEKGMGKMCEMSGIGMGIGGIDMSEMCGMRMGIMDIH